MTTGNQQRKRLEEIAASSFGTLSDDDILRLLAERKELGELVRQSTLVEEQERQAQQKEARAMIIKELDRLNRLISPDKPDDELIHLIEERRGFEAKLATLDAHGTEEEGKQDATDPTPSVAASEKKARASLSNEISEKESPLPRADTDFGHEGIAQDSIEENSDFSRIIDEIKRNADSIGKILEDLPLATRRNKAFMLAVAKIDPAYAMHYADAETLKKDEDFNLKVIALKNERRSGGVLSEMLPEARTATVVMAAVKQDYRNVRFVLPQMEGYDDIIERAKTGALEKVRDLKDSVDVSFIIPKVLQKDQAFMKKVAEIAPEV